MSTPEVIVVYLAVIVNEIGWLKMSSDHQLLKIARVVERKIV